jgi:hypothetical protein
MTRLVQLQNGAQRRVALVEEPHLRLLDSATPTVYALAQAALAAGEPPSAIARRQAGKETLDYDAIHAGRSPWRLLPPVDHPADPARCTVSGTGLTHLGSAKNRAAMHDKTDAELTDSMKIFRWGLERGRPAPGQIGVAPEWFHKGNGLMLRAPGDPLDVPAYAEDGGEEAEIAGVYLIGPDGAPLRLGMAVGNEFSDHVFERKNYLNLAGSKARTCAIGPELVLDPDFRSSVPGKVAIHRAGAVLWAKDIASGEAEMCHSLANIEHHHFKFEACRRPGDLHVHFYGACALSHGEGVHLTDGDVMEISFTGFGRPLRNPLRVLPGPDRLVTVRPLG